MGVKADDPARPGMVRVLNSDGSLREVLDPKIFRRRQDKTLRKRWRGRANPTTPWRGGRPKPLPPIEEDE